MGGLTIWIHPECAVRELHGTGWAAVVVGDIYVAHGHASVEELIQRLIDNDDFDALDQLGGRFALVGWGRSGRRVFHDAFGSRSVFYRKGECLALASHAGLLATVFGDSLDPAAVAFRDSAEYSQRGTSYLPGDRTMYKRIHALTPNNYYDIDSQTIHRYWPRVRLQPGTVADFQIVSDEYFQRTSEFLVDRYRPLLGLTGGVDARSLIAGLRWAGTEGSFFTWAGGRVQDEELPLIDAIARHIGWEHAFVDIGRGTAEAADPLWKRVTALATGYSRNPSALTANMARIVSPRDVFLRGYGGEVIRGFYNRHKRVLENRTPDELFGIYLTRRVTKPPVAFINFAVQAFETFVENASFNADFLGRDPLDLFYWEHRMGTWGSLMLNEMDPVVYSMAGLNSRKMYDTAFAITPSDRLGEELLLGLVARYDPHLSAIGSVS